MTASWKCIVVVHNMIVTKRIANLPVSGCYGAWVTLTCLHDRKLFCICGSLAGCNLSWTMIESCNYRTLTHMVAQCTSYLHYLNLLMELRHFLPVLHEHITAVSWYKQNKMECFLKVREKDTVAAMQTVIDGHRVSERWTVNMCKMALKYRVKRLLSAFVPANGITANFISNSWRFTTAVHARAKYIVFHQG